MTDNPIGRPSKFSPEIGERILGYMTEGLSLAAAAAECDIARNTVYNWCDEHPEFLSTVNLAKSKRQLFLERRLLSAAEGPVVTSSIFALKNAGQGDWRDKVETELSGGITVKQVEWNVRDAGD